MVLLFVQGICVSSANAQSYIFGRADFAVGNGPLAVAAGDLNGDGITDLVAVNSTDNTVSVLLGSANGTFAAPVNYPTGTYPASVALGDFNRDGILDFAVTNENCTQTLRQGLSCESGTVSVFVGNGDGTFRPKVDYATGAGPASVAVSDINSDGNLDLVVADVADGSVSILLGNGDGTFQNQNAIQLEDNAGLNQLQGAIVVSDFNGDGNPDIAVGVYEAWILLGNGDGTFQTPVSLDLTPVAYLAAGDFNHDGRMDLIANGIVNGTVLLGNGDGTFIQDGTYSGGFVTVADFNGDGHLDFSASTAVYLGNGDGTFQPALTYGTGPGPAGMAVGDFNGDGRLDLAVADSASNTISILLGVAGGPFVGKTGYLTGGTPPPQGPNSIVLADFNNDASQTWQAPITAPAVVFRSC